MIIAHVQITRIVTTWLVLNSCFRLLYSHDTSCAKRKRNRRVEELDACYSGVIGDTHNGELHDILLHVGVLTCPGLVMLELLRGPLGLRVLYAIPSAQQRMQRMRWSV